MFIAVLFVEYTTVSFLVVFGKYVHKYITLCVNVQLKFEYNKYNCLNINELNL
jgi:hypothetical protein